MASLNKVMLMGNLTRDPEVRVTPSGLKIAKLGMAVNRRYRTRDEETKEETTFVDIDAFGQQAEVIERYCEKGTPLFVEGRLRLEQWQTREGENRSKLTVVLEGFQFIGSKSSASASSSDSTSHSNEDAGSYDSSNNDASPPSRDSGDNVAEDDVPF
jgi:single-strand DNA-binding protein